MRISAGAWPVRVISLIVYNLLAGIGTGRTAEEEAAAADDEFLQDIDEENMDVFRSTWAAATAASANFALGVIHISTHTA